MKKSIVCFSDTHSLENNVIFPDGDILICAGDFTNIGKLPDVTKFAKNVGKLPHKYKIIIAGNHDFCFENELTNTSRKILEDNGFIYLKDSEVIIDDIKFYGSPYQPFFCHWAFNILSEYEREKIWDKIPIDTNVLITHSPPYGILDKTLHGDNTGCKPLKNRIDKLKDLKLNIFGHIHEQYGMIREENIRYINCSICNRNYEPINKPIKVEVC